MIKKICLCLISVFLLAACSDDVPERPIEKRAGRTIFSYLIAQEYSSSADLSQYLRKNVIDMYSGIAADGLSATLMVYYRPGYRDVHSVKDPIVNGPSILKFNFDGHGRVNGKQVLPLNNVRYQEVFAQAEIHPCRESHHIATSPVTMRSVFKEMKRLAPSDSYGLILGSHGTGWMPGNSVKTKAFGDDNRFNIDIPVLAEVLKESFPDDNLDFILFDACMMATAEVCYELRDVTDYCVGSVMETPVDGFPYPAIISTLYKKHVDYQRVCNEFIEYNRVNNLWGTCAAVDCSQMQPLADWVKTNLNATYPAWEGDFYTNVQQYGWSSYQNFSFDLVDTFRQLYGEAPVGLLDLMDKVVVGKACLSGEEYGYPGLYYEGQSMPGRVVVDGARFCGIGMYLPPCHVKEEWDEYYRNSISWSKAVGWYDPR